MNYSDDDLISGAAAARLLGHKKVEHLKPIIDNGMLKKRFTPISKRARFRRGDVLALITDEPPAESLISVDFREAASV